MRLLRRLIAAVAVGFGTIFGSKTAHQHWSETTSALVSEDRESDEAGED